MMKYDAPRYAGPIWLFPLRFIMGMACHTDMRVLALFWSYGDHMPNATRMVLGKNIMLPWSFFGVSFNGIIKFE